MHGADDRLLVVCPYVKVLMYSMKCLEEMGSQNVIINKNNEYVDTTGDPVTQEEGCCGWIRRNSHTGSTKGMHNNFYSGGNHNMGLARTGCPPKRVTSILQAKNNMDHHIHMKKCIDSGVNYVKTPETPRFIWGCGTKLTELLERGSNAQWAQQNVRPIGLNPERAARPCSGNVCGDSWINMLGTSNRQNECLKCLSETESRKTDMVTTSGGIRRCNQNLGSNVYPVFMVHNNKSEYEEEKGWLTDSCNKEDGMYPVRLRGSVYGESTLHRSVLTYDEMIPVMHRMHSVSINSLGHVDMLFYVDQMDTYKRDGTLTEEKADFLKDRLNNKFLKSESKVYNVIRRDLPTKLP